MIKRTDAIFLLTLFTLCFVHAVGAHAERKAAVTDTVEAEYQDDQNTFKELKNLGDDQYYEDEGFEVYEDEDAGSGEAV